MSKGKEDYVELFFDAWMNSDGMIWKEELSERDYIFTFCTHPNKIHCSIYAI